MPQFIQQPLPQASSGPQNFSYPVAQSQAYETYPQGQYSGLQPEYVWPQTESGLKADGLSSSAPYQATMQQSLDAGLLQSLDSPMSNGKPGMSSLDHVLRLAS